MAFTSDASLFTLYKKLSAESEKPLEGCQQSLCHAANTVRQA
jgi:hypothetical protein